MQDINLLPVNYRASREKRRKRIVRITLVILLIFFVCTALYLPIKVLRDMENKITSLEVEMGDMEKAREQRIILEELEKEIARREDIINHLRKNSLHWSDILEDIRTRLPRDTALIQLDYTGGNGGTMVIAGEAGYYSSVAELLVNLKEIELLEKVEPESIVKEEGVYKFTLRCILKGGSEDNETE